MNLINNIFGEETPIINKNYKKDYRRWLFGNREHLPRRYCNVPPTKEEIDKLTLDAKEWDDDINNLKNIWRRIRMKALLTLVIVIATIVMWIAPFHLATKILLTITTSSSIFAIFTINKEIGILPVIFLIISGLLGATSIPMAAVRTVYTEIPDFKRSRLGNTVVIHAKGQIYSDDGLLWLEADSSRFRLRYTYSILGNETTNPILVVITKGK